MKARIGVSSLMLFLITGIANIVHGSIVGFPTMISQDTLPVPFSYDEKNNIYSQARVVGKNLVINLKIPAEIDQHKILQFGLTAWIDTLGKNHQHLGIQYPYLTEGRPDFRSPGKEGPGSRQPMSKEERAEMLSEHGQIMLLGFSGKKSSIKVPAYTYHGIQGSMDVGSSGELLYYLIIPVDRVVKCLNDKVVISIRFESGSMKMPQGPMNASPGRQGRSGGGTAPGGMSRGGDRQGPYGQHPGANPMVDVRKMSKPLRFTIKNIVIWNPAKNTGY
jgi:hypothetical protein